MKLPLGRIAEFIAATGEFDRKALAQAYSIDSRKIAPRELFFAVKGERLDGHDFVEAALAAGALAAVVGRERYPSFADKSRLLVVDDTLAALQALGSAVRHLWGKPLIAVTGSAGKTTTKEAIAHLLATRYQIFKSEGNLNNHFGLPLQLLRLQPEHEIGVVELGMSHAGEIRDLAQIARPNMGVVTNVAPVHLGFFNSVAEIARAKYELVESLPSSATAVLNAGDEYVVQFGKDFKGKVVTFAIGRPADVRAENVEQRGTDGSVFDVIAGSRRERARLPLVGVHNVSNALAAIAVARENGIDLAPAVAALGTLAPADKRGQVMQLAGATVVNDCYNSNPKALISMVDALAGMRPGDDGRRIIVAGEMLELGSAGEQLHRRCGAHMAERGIDLVLGVRGLAQHIVEAAREGGAAAAFVPTSDEAGEWLAREVRPGDVVLLKASRGVRLEKALEVWQQLAAATAGQVHS